MSGLEARAVARAIEAARAAGVDVPPDVLSIHAKLEHGTDALAAFPRWQADHPGEEPPPEASGCCYGSAVYGYERCECWEPVYDVEQADPVLPVAEGSIEVRAARCGDCAFRRGSKERSEEYTEDELLGLAAAGTPFWCHDGMRRPKWYEHPVLGRVKASGDDWRPPQVAGVPFRRDGQPGLLCAGWAQEVRRQERLATSELA